MTKMTQLCKLWNLDFSSFGVYFGLQCRVKFEHGSVTIHLTVEQNSYQNQNVFKKNYFPNPL